jgi:hypothetical protein
MFRDIKYEEYARGRKFKCFRKWIGVIFASVLDYNVKIKYIELKYKYLMI